MLFGAAVAVAVLPNQPAISGITPANGDVVTVWNPTVTAALSDAAAINPAGTLVLDGVPRTAPLTFPEVGGHWEGDGCDVYWVPDYDYLHGNLAYVAPTLADGSHSATLTVSDSGGNSNSYAWSFAVQAPPKVDVHEDGVKGLAFLTRRQGALDGGPAVFRHRYVDPGFAKHEGDQSLVVLAIFGHEEAARQRSFGEF